MENNLFYKFGDKEDNFKTSTQILKSDSTNIFIRKICFGSFKLLPKENKIRKVDVNKDKLVLIYNSKNMSEKRFRDLMKDFGKLGRLIEKTSERQNFISNDENLLLNRKYFLGIYDTYYNSKNRLKLFDKTSSLPCLRIYRQEDGLNGFYKERCKMYSYEKMVEFLIDHSFEDFMISSYDI